MKRLRRLTLMAACFSLMGCSSLAQIMQSETIDTLDQAWTQSISMDRQVGSLRIYNAAPYAVHLEVEETDLQQEGLEQHLYGDGGASLNAYAACLTLKVIF